MADFIVFAALMWIIFIVSCGIVNIHQQIEKRRAETRQEPQEPPPLRVPPAPVWHEVTGAQADFAKFFRQEAGTRRKEVRR